MKYTDENFGDSIAVYETIDDNKKQIGVISKEGRFYDAYVSGHGSVNTDKGFSFTSRNQALKAVIDQYEKNKL